MKTSTFLSTLAAPLVAADWMCPAHISQNDKAPLTFAWQVQQLLTNYYESVPVNASFFEGLPMSDSKGMNGMSLAADTVTNVEGLGKQAQLGSKAIKEAMGMLDMDMDNMMGQMTCDYSYPDAPTGKAHLMNAYYLEATLCGTFIGLADYTMSPQASFLMARMSAEHGIHASALRAKMQDVGFMPNSTSLTPAFTPEHVMMSADDMSTPGKLGQFLNGCNMNSPEAPCSGNVKIGPLLAQLNGQKSGGNGDMCSSSGSSSGSGSDSGSGSGSSTMMPSGSMGSMPSATSGPAEVETAAASKAQTGGFAAVAVGVFAALLV